MNDKVLTDAAATRAMEPHARPFRYREGLGGGRARLGKEENMSWGVGPAKTLGRRPHGGDLALLVQKWEGDGDYHRPGSVIQLSQARAVLVGIPIPCLLLWPPEGSRWQVSVQILPPSQGLAWGPGLHP